MATETYQKVKQYLAGLEEGHFGYGDDTNSSYSLESKTSDIYASSLSELAQQSHTLPRLSKPIAPEVNHDPLKFVATKTGAEIFTLQAREQITQIEQQKKLREQILEKESSIKQDDEVEWSATLEKWKKKRSMDIQKALVPSISSQEKEDKVGAMTRMMENRVAQIKKQFETPKKDEKEEILTITSPSADEFTDSGIENNRFTSTPHSPSTSTDFSPRSDKPTPISSRFIRTASPLVEDVPPPLPSVPPPPLPSGHDDELNKDETDEDYVVETLRPYVEMENMVETKKEFAYSKESSYPYKMPNRTHSEESIKLDQVVVGLTLSKERYDEDLKTALAEREAFFKTTSTTYPAKFDSLSRSSLSLSEQIERPSDLSIKETTASFNCKKTYEENAKVDAVVAQPAYDTAEKRVIKERKLWKREEMGEIPLDVVSPLSPLPIQETKRAAAIDGSAAVTRDKSTKTVSVGVEVCREQNAKVSAFKFPNKLSRESVVLTVKPSGKMSPVTHFRTVDIPFDDTPSMEPIVTSHKAQSLEGGNLPDPNGMMVVKMQLNSGSESPGFDRFDNHGFGFSLRGGKEHNAPLAVDTVLVNTPADRCGLQVGDIVLNINGESTIDKYYQTAKRMLNEAIRLGEIEMQIQRSSGPSTFLHKDINKSDEVPLMKSPSFDDRRIVFERKPSETNSYYEFKQKRQTRRFEGPSEPAHKASGSISSVSPQSSKSSDYGHDDTSDHLTIDSRGTPDSLHHIPRRTPKKMLRCDSPDYRVVSLDDKPDPGRLDDFVPEVERETKMIEGGTFALPSKKVLEENKVSRVPSRRLERNEEPKLIRNYDLNLVKRSNESLHSIRSRTSSVQKESVDAAVGDKENDEDDEKSDIDRPVVLAQSAVQAEQESPVEPKVLHRVPELETTELVTPFEGYPPYPESKSKHKKTKSKGSISSFIERISGGEEPRAPKEEIEQKEERFQLKEEPEIVTLSCRNSEIVPMTFQKLEGVVEYDRSPRTPSKLEDRRDYRLVDEEDGELKNGHLAEEEDFDEIYSKIDETQKTSTTEYSKRSTPKTSTLESRTSKISSMPSPKPIEQKVFIVQHKVSTSPARNPRRVKYQYWREREEEHYETVEEDTRQDTDGYTIPQLHQKRPYVYSYHHIPHTVEKEPIYQSTQNRPVYRREIPIYVERRPTAAAHTSTLPSTPYNRQAVPYSGIYSPPKIYANPYEDEAKVSRTTYKFYDRNMREVNPATSVAKIDRARRATRSFEDGLDVFGRNVSYSPQIFEERREVIERDTREWRQFIREQRLPNPGHTSSLNHINADSKFEIIHKPTTFGSTNVSSTLRPIIKTVERNVIARRDEREIPVKLETASYSPQKPSRKDDSTSAQQNGDEPIMSVSGKHKCAHCHQELGRGAAMIIESLNLFYHLSCFRCYVCNIPLGNGTKGADVRVRDTKLHCQKCYSNDEINMKFSQI